MYAKEDTRQNPLTNMCGPYSEPEEDGRKPVATLQSTSARSLRLAQETLVVE